MTNFVFIVRKWDVCRKNNNFLGQAKMKNLLNYRIGKWGNKQSGHPAEKPEFFIQWLIEVFTNRGGIELDSFAIKTVSVEDTHVAGKERHGESIAKLRTSATRADAPLPAGWASL